MGGGTWPRILFGAQPQSSPPMFLLFTAGFLEASYRSCVIESRRLAEFGFVGSPTEIQ